MQLLLLARTSVSKRCSPWEIVPPRHIICVDVSDVLARIPVCCTGTASLYFHAHFFTCAPEPIARVQVLSGVPEEKKYCREGWNRKLIRRCVSHTQADAALAN